MKSRSRALAACLAAACLAAALSAASAGAAAPAWEPIAASGPTNLPPVQSEIQRVAVDAEEGTYTLTYTAAAGSGKLSRGSQAFGSYASGATQITFFAPPGPNGFEKGQTIISGNPGIQPETEITNIVGNALIISKPTTEARSFQTITAASKTVSELVTTAGGFTPGQTIAGTGIPVETTIEAVGANTLTLDKYPTQRGTQALSVASTTGAIGFNAEASAVQTALNDLELIGGAGGSVSVTGGPGGPKAQSPYNVAFDGGTLANTDIVQLTADSSGLLGGDNHVAQVFTVLDGGAGTSTVAIYAQNVGGLPSSGVSTVDVTLPAGVVTEETPGGTGWSCISGGAGSEFSCTSTRVAGPGLTLPTVRAPVLAEPGAKSGTVEIEVSGGGAVGPASYEMPLTVSEIPAPPGLQSFTAAPYTDTGAIDVRAGGHPYSASTGILVNTVRSASGAPVPVGEFRDIVVDTPPGFFGNPTATPSCPEATEQEDCPHNTIVATAQVPVGVFGLGGERSAVNSIEAPFGYPAKFRFITGNRQIIVNVAAALRSDEDYGLEIGSYNTPQIQPVFGAFFTIWGTPADPAHDEQRCAGFNMESDCRTAAEVFDEEVAFLTNPVDCAEEARRAPVATINVNTWQNPGQLFSQDVALEPIEGCDELQFEDEGFSFEPNTDDSDSPASFTTELEVPAGGLLSPDPEARTNPTIRQTVVDLPEGVVLNASAADGLEACSEQQIGLLGAGMPLPNRIRFSKAPDSCPNASKIGTGELQSELIDEPLSAELFLAEQEEGNPFGSLFAIYLVIENPRNGIFIKLPGEVQVDEDDGRQRIVFRDLPPLPFSSLKLKLKGGARSPLATPTTCDDYTTKATNTPWSAPESGPPLTSPSEFEIDEGPGGGDCADSPGERPFDLGLRAGTESVQAGAFSPLTLQVTRPDGAQELDTLEFAPPPGLAASLKGIPYCPEAALAAAASRDGEAEQDSPSCPAASRVGRALAGAGSGPRPFYAPGELYLAGPYKGAPLSIVAITPAVAGPFDLGNVIVRSAIFVNPVTAQVSAKTDPLPQVVQGVPLRIRDVRVILDRPGFALNPSGCEEKAIAMRATGASGAVTDLATRFQVGNCEALGFKPQMGLRLFGGVKRGAYQGLRAVVRPKPGDANISRTVVRMPRSAFLAQEHIRTVCTRVQFAADACPKGAIYGKAVAWSPLLDQPLRGNVYLRSSDNELPDVVADLRGPAHQPIKVEVVGRTDSVKGALRNTFDVVPDAPVSYFRLQLFGGKKGLIVNSRNICRGANRATVGLNAHNGRRALLRPALRNKRCAVLRKKQRRAAKRSAHRSKRPGA